MTFSTPCHLYCSHFSLHKADDIDYTSLHAVGGIKSISPRRPDLTEKLSPYPDLFLISLFARFLFAFIIYCSLKSLLLHYSPSFTLPFFGLFIIFLLPFSFLLSSHASMIWPCCSSRRIDFSFGLCVKAYLNSARRNFLFPQSWMELILFHEDTFRCILSVCISLFSPSSCTHLLHWVCRSRAGMIINATSIATKR